MFHPNPTQRGLSPSTHTDQTQGSMDLSYDIISYIMRTALGPLDVLRASAVNREWRRAAQEQYIWQAFIRREFGDTLLRKATRSSGSGSGQVDAKAFYAQMACFQPGALMGWCEDPVTASGNPYAMYLGEMSSNSSMFVRDHGSMVLVRRASLVHTRTIECRCLWTYAVSGLGL
ncbi:hypothetical protein DUNSADRAFT_13943 [Dunaliella salina]|uniref:F-box domain-containing protein n=1 Tax=Dunaliella salina TaxID=3046 RepID=A0ABQ7G8D1_DUNSA|nr:hypothetical protein DUNSADRAFT_13943 [Dunaliella salina]|eukprot:KAF5830863.1 hypothetical protein DUNSADRAFT_13943 [Dunaliella salina]